MRISWEGRVLCPLRQAGGARVSDTEFGKKRRITCSTPLRRWRSMADDDPILELLVRWEELRTQGKLLTPEELCPEDPSLWEVLRTRLTRRLRLDPLLEPQAPPGPPD